LWRWASPPSLFSPSSLRIRSGIEEYPCSYGISTDTVATLVERSFTPLCLLARISSGIEEYYCCCGLSTATMVVTLVERGFTSLSLLALLPLDQIRYRGVPPLLWYLNTHSGNTGGEGLHLPVSSRHPPSASDQV
jgi:hypothetical protein